MWYIRSAASHHDEGEESTETTLSSLQPSSVHHRRKLLDNRLSNYKQDKLKRKLPVDSQLVSCAQEELQIKRRLVDQMDRMEKQYSDNMSRLLTNMETIINSISEGFSIIRTLFGLQPMYPHTRQVFPFHHSSVPMPSPAPFGAFDSSTTEAGYGQEL